MTFIVNTDGSLSELNELDDITLSHNSTKRTTLPVVFDINLPENITNLPENCINQHGNSVAISDQINIPNDDLYLDEYDKNQLEDNINIPKDDTNLPDNDTNLPENKINPPQNNKTAPEDDLILPENSVKLGTNVRIFKTMFLNTLPIGEWMALRWQGEDNYENSEEAVNSDGEVNLNGGEQVEEPRRKK
ncbi:hypothetical protein J6590_031314 [Homalodisca vitripennis]|nr:hypothetical protein J6590_031314 [Homalodisca vitripennis]